jgi:hypothetical protein
MKTSLRLASLALYAVAAVAASAKVTEKFSQTYPLTAAGSIHVSNINGSVEIVAWDRNEVAVEAEKSAKNADALARIHLKIESGPSRLSIRTEHEMAWKFWNSANAQVRYKLMVPAGATLDEIDVVNANITVTGLKGRVKLDTVNGSIDARDLAGPGEFETVNGSIKVTYARLPAGKEDEISLDTTNGNCTLTLPADAAFDLDADTVNGRVTCDFPITLEKSGRNDLRGTIAGGGISVELDSVNGGLKVAKAAAQ